MTIEEKVEQIFYLIDLQKDRARALDDVERKLANWPPKPEDKTKEYWAACKQQLRAEAGRLRFAIEMTRQKLNNTWIYC